MTVVPLPDVPCVRVRLDYKDTANQELGNRFYLSYSGSAPSGANCNTLAADIGSAWASNYATQVHTDISLVQVEVIDIATHTGASGTDSTVHAGTRSGTSWALQSAVNIEFGIARRYRGGKPRIYMPPGTVADTADNANWNSTFPNGCATAFAAFIAAVEALSIGSMGTLVHVNLSFFQGFTNHTNTSGRSRAVPTYRSTALHDNVTSYIGRAKMGSQRRRRSATTF